MAGWTYLFKPIFYRFLSEHLRARYNQYILAKKLRNKFPSAKIDLDVKLVGVENIYLGDSVKIDKSCYINAGGIAYCGHDGHVQLGNHVIMGHQSMIFAGGGKVQVGDLTRIGIGVIIAAQAEDSFANPDVKPDAHTLIFEEITIGQSCMIAGGAIILGGTELGNHCIVGAGAVVKGKYPDNATLIGNPARAIPRIKSMPE
jgi:acetyltransferase-like isoleucine patch superfamily enzyme